MESSKAVLHVTIMQRLTLQAEHLIYGFDSNRCFEHTSQQALFLP